VTCHLSNAAFNSSLPSMFPPNKFTFYQERAELTTQKGVVWVYISSLLSSFSNRAQDKSFNRPKYAVHIFLLSLQCLLPESTIRGHCKFHYSRITNLSPRLNSPFVKRTTNTSNGHQCASTPSTTYHAYLSNKDSMTRTRTYLHQSHSSTVDTLSDVRGFINVIT